MDCIWTSNEQLKSQTLESTVALYIAKKNEARTQDLEKKRR